MKKRKRATAPARKREREGEKIEARQVAEEMEREIKKGMEEIAERSENSKRGKIFQKKKGHVIEIRKAG